MTYEWVFLFVISNFDPYFYGLLNFLPNKIYESPSFPGFITVED